MKLAGSTMIVSARVNMKVKMVAIMPIAIEPEKYESAAIANLNALLKVFLITTTININNSSSITTNNPSRVQLPQLILDLGWC
jgi:hypothetical protein